MSVRSAGSDRPLTVGADDEGLSRAFTAHAEPVREAYAWLAEVALMSIAADEARAGPVGVVVQPETWDANPEFLATVLAGLQGNPLVRPATAAQYFAEVPPAVGDDGQLVERGLAPSAPEDLTGYAADRTESQLGLVAFGSMVAPTSSLPAELDQLLQVSPARDLSPQARSAYLAAVDEQLDELRQSVDQVPARTITLAGRTTELPITLTSRAEGAVAGEGPAAQQQAGLPGRQRAPRHDHRRRRAGPGADRGSDQRDVPRHHRRSSRRSATRSSRPARSSRCARPA